MSTSPSLSLRREDLKDAKGEWVEKLVQSLTSFGSQTHDAFDRNISLLENLNATLKTLDITTKDDWIAPTLTNSWVNLGSSNTAAGYRKRFGMTEIRGTIASGTLTAAAFTLPVGYRPPITEWRSIVSNYAFGAFYVHPIGWVVPHIGSNVWFDLTCSFQSTDPTPVQNPCFPVTFKHGLKGTARPLAVLATDGLDVTDKASGQHVSTSVSWQALGDSVQILDLPGLLTNRHYRVTFLVFGG